MVVAGSSNVRSARSPVAVYGSALPRLVRDPDGHQAAVREDGTPVAGSALAYRGTWGRPFGGQHGDATVAMCTRARSSAETQRVPFKTCETVLVDTPARCATIAYRNHGLLRAPMPGRVPRATTRANVYRN